jgi:uncharacterized metal-binding protein YceD (DUF177 family)
MHSDITPEFSHPIPLSEIGSTAVAIKLIATDAQCIALAQRFDLLTLDALSAAVSVRFADDSVVVSGTLTASLTQSCVTSGASIPAKLSEDFAVRFIPDPAHAPNAEIELEADDCDIIFHDGNIVDAGEAVAQTLGLAINPFPRQKNAAAALKKAGLLDGEATGPFAALAALRNKQT